jgi:hypothetical protein
MQNESVQYVQYTGRHKYKLLFFKKFVLLWQNNSGYGHDKELCFFSWEIMGLISWGIMEMEIYNTTERELRNRKEKKLTDISKRLYHLHTKNQ